MNHRLKSKDASNVAKPRRNCFLVWSRLWVVLRTADLFEDGSIAASCPSKCREDRSDDFIDTNGAVFLVAIWRRAMTVDT